MDCYQRHVFRTEEVRGNSRKRKRLKCFGLISFFSLGLSFLTISWALLVHLHCHNGSAHSLPSKHVRVLWNILHAQQRNSTQTQSWISIFQKSSLLDQYCNTQNSPIVGLEGFVPPDYQLIQVHIVLSPATDVPLLHRHNRKKRKQTSYSQHHHSSHSHDKVLNIKEYNQEIKNLPLFRDFFNYVHNEDISSTSVLYQRFTLEHHRIGTHLNKIYLDKWNLESSRIRPKHFILSANDSFEAYSSLLATLYTFLPRNLFRSLRSDFITTLPKCNITRTKNKSVQVIEQQQFSLNNYTADSFLDRTSLKSIFKQYFSNSDVSMYEFLSNVCNNISLPCLSDHLSVKQAQSLLHEVQSNIDDLLSKQSQDKEFECYSDIVIFPYLDTLITRLHKAERLFQKIFVHAFGIKQIYHLFSALRYQPSTLPKLGSRVVFELYKSNSDMTSHYIKVLYNGEDITHSIPLCNSKGQLGLCELKYFVDYHKIKHMSL